MATASDNTLTTASDALKAALANFINRFKVLTDKITIVDGLLKKIGIAVTIYVNTAYDLTNVKNTAQLYLDTYMSGYSNNFGDPFNISKIYELLSGIDGIDHSVITDISDNGVSQLTTGNGQVRDITTLFNEVWTKDFVTLTAVFN
jgi:phage-related baseplate assembly protein